MDSNYLSGRIQAALLGIACGDSLGRSYEFLSRNEIREMFQEIVDRDGGTHNQAKGTYTDDTCLTLCLTDSLCNGFDLEDIADKFVKWYDDGLWAADGKTVFDIGISTRNAIKRLKSGVSPLESGDNDEYSNGNGSLMRILPLVFYIKDIEIDDRFELTKQVSSITHAHNRSVISCFYYLEFARLLLSSTEKLEAYRLANETVKNYLISIDIKEQELGCFDVLLSGNISDLPEELINSSGYVVDTLEASVYCLLTTQSFKEAAVKAVRFGLDADTTSAVTSGLTSLVYGLNSIPNEWLGELARRDEIDALANRFADSICSTNESQN
ncbi:ADP-ribosylglycohydrolase family protein [Rufibacter quisquiliarum]|uniref:ADP-ribosylglycohydrolase n=1 Tax=Rufibacter quisquiliarum TaxID=1549639 RepID=A0A839GTS0_9BACT|nr:ADP-ribosylglycohydrolase family protein [Rufibacter quisquiliarum]MBA9078206.1 ADP-ribosylglycohydrolase [Rufibacter quisquiliarum]